MMQTKENMSYGNAENDSKFKIKAQIYAFYLFISIYQSKFK